jgi:AraC-like DNA-binding protein
MSALSNPADKGSIMRFSTADYAPRDRLAAWHDIFGKTLIKLDIEPVETEAFHADVRIRNLPGLRVMAGSRSAATYHRTPACINNDDFVLSFGLAGGFEAAQSGRTATMEPGDAVVVTGAEPGHVTFPSSGRSLTVCIPARAIAGQGATRCRRIPADNAALRLLSRYVGILDEDDTLAAPALQHHAVTHVHDLIALALGTTRDETEIAQARGARAARLHAIKQDVAQNLARDDLSVATIAARHRLAVRYVQRLFEVEGVTFTDFVLDQRLARAHRMLTAPRLASLKVGVIATEAGFSDLSYFNRAFRRRYGASPSDVRAQVLRGN